MDDQEKYLDGQKPPSRNNSRNGSVTGKISEDMFTTRKVDQDRVNLEPQKIIAGLYKYKWLIVLLTILGGGVAWFYADSLTPQYQTSGTVMILTDGGMPYYAGGDLGSMLTRNLGLGAGRSIDNQLQIMRSRSFAERVASEVMERQTMNNGERFPILFEETEDGIRDRSHAHITGLIRGQTQVIRPDRNLNNLRIWFTSTSPREAMEIANLFMDEYVNMTKEHSRETIRSTLDYLENIMLKEVQERLERSEKEVQEFMREVSGGVDVSQYITRLINNMDVIEEQIELREVDMIAMRQQKENIESELDAIRPGMAEQIKMATGARLTLLQGRIADLSIERMLILNRNPSLRANESMEPRLLEINRDMELFRNETEELVNSMQGSLGFQIGDASVANNQRMLELQRTLLNSNIEMHRAELLVERLQQRLLQYEEQLNRLPGEQPRLARMQRDQLLNARIYTDLATRQIELELLEQSTDGSGRIFDYALIPGTPFFPNWRNILMIGFVVGFISSTGLVTLFVMLNKKIDSIDLLKQYELPVMAIVPEMDSYIKQQFSGKQFCDVEGKRVSTSLVTLFDPISNVSEAYRRLYNNIKYNNPDTENNIFLVTSPSKSEGKSTCVSNLAIAIAESGKKVLLMDCDFRRPRLHRIFGIPREPGITNFLFDDQPVDELISETLAGNLYLMTAGTKPNSPGLATNSEKMAELISEVSNRFDYILMDTPPFGIITDSAPLIRLSDGVIALARFNLTITPELDQLIENLRSVRAEIIGTVLMDYKPDLASGYYTYNRMYAYNYSVYKNYHKSEEKVS